MSSPQPTTDFHPSALATACVLPGLGHIVRGEVARGAYIMASLLAMFVGGIFLGGVDVVDSKEDRVWFYAQALVGPAAFGVDYYHQNRLKVIAPSQDRSGRMIRRSAFPTEGRNPDGTAKLGGRPPNTKSVGRMNELGTLACALAGMINLIVIIDAGFPTIRPRKPQPSPRAGDATSAELVGKSATSVTPPAATGGTA
jgi:hypothetical protein